jgi:hypothetical protein
LRPAVAKDLASLVAELMNQWGYDLPPLAGDEALTRMKAALMAVDMGSFVTIIRAESLEVSYLPALLGALATRLPGEAGARITILLSAGAAGPDAIPGAQVIQPDWEAISEENIRQHLSLNWGWSEEDSHKKAATACRLDLGQQPGRLYTFLWEECVAWDPPPSIF